MSNWDKRQKHKKEVVHPRERYQESQVRHPENPWSEGKMMNGACVVAYTGCGFLHKNTRELSTYVKGN